MSIWFKNFYEGDVSTACGEMSVSVSVMALISADFNSPYFSTSPSGIWCAPGWSRGFMTDKTGGRR